MNRRDEELTDIPQMKPARDELANRRPSGATATRTRSSSGGSGVWVILSLLVAIAALGASYFLWEQSVRAEQAAAQAEARIAELESQLASTGDELTQSDAAVRVKLKELDSEVRKLWDSRKKAKAMSAEHDKTIKNLVTRTSATRKKVDSLLAQTTAISASLDEVVETLDGADFETQSSLLKKNADQLRSVEADMKDLQSRITANEEWIESINAFRQQVNQRLNPPSSVPASPQLQ